jgi:hypothetical protein
MASARRVCAWRMMPSAARSMREESGSRIRITTFSPDLVGTC